MRVRYSLIGSSKLVSTSVVSDMPRISTAEELMITTSAPELTGNRQFNQLTKEVGCLVANRLAMEVWA